MPSLRVRLASALLTSGVLFTFTWIFIGLNNSGDAFPQGNARLLLPLIAVLPPIGAWLGYRRASRRWITAGLVLAAPALAFWLLASPSWWAVGPPPR